jgi:hypothetical protein
MKDKILSINLETEVSPIIKEVRGKDYIEYGTDEWKNLYPQFLIDLYYNSSTHAAIINATSEMIAGEDLICEDEDDKENLDAYVKLKQFLRHANSKESMHQVVKKLAFDFKLQGAYALHILWNQERTEIAEVYHIPVERVRAGRPNEMGKVDTYFISADWSNIRENPPHPICAFSTTDRREASQILYTGLYSPNMDIYHTPDYIAANNWALVDQRVAEFHLNNIQNGFSGSYFISFANGIPTQEERFQIESSLVEKFSGAKNSGKFILTFSDDKTRTPEITPISVSDADKQYLALQELLVQNILTGHRVTSPMLMGIKSDSGLGNNADELNTAANFYLNTVVRPFQLNILDTLQTIFSVNQCDLEVGFVQLKPITTRFTNQDLADVMTEDEIREELGLPPLNVEVREDFSKVCCNHDDSKALELENWIQEFGEDITEDDELIHDEVVDGEHMDFDFEKVINKRANTMLAKSITARPNARTRDKKNNQDGVNKSFNDYYKVRYVYTASASTPNKSGKSRDFCRMMMSANKVYRKQDIVSANSLQVNPGFGPNGTGRYNLFLYKGGPQCRHYWSRRIYKSSLRAARQPIKDSQIISYTKAKSEGFTAKKNDKLVAIPPQKMKNNGYLKPR